MHDYRVISRDHRINGLVISADPKTVERRRFLNTYVRGHGYIDIPTSAFEELDDLEEEDYEPQRERAVRDQWH